ncbi:MAG: GDP-mannose 4,6-dehydratase [Anaerolineae bacterium]
MRVLITGITGFAGGHLAMHLARNTAVELYGIDRNATRLPAALQGRATVFEGDLLVESFVKEVLQQVRPTAVFHLAGQAFVPAAWENPWETFQLNVLPQLNLFKASLELGLTARFVTVTSGKLYGHVPPERMPLNEETPFQPDNPYDLSKVTQDLMARQYFFSHNLPVIRARPFNHIGPRQSPNFVTSSFARQIARAEAGLALPVVKVGNLSAARDFSDVRDVVRAYALLMDNGRPGQAYNIGSGRAVTIRQILDMLVGMSRVTIKVEPDPARMRPVDQPISYGDIGKIAAHVGWRPEISLEESLRQVLDYWREAVIVESRADD